MKPVSSIMTIAAEVSEVSGVQLGEKQREMVVQRLRRRMTHLGLHSEGEYIQYYVHNRQDEFRELLSLFTTHHTYFFREFKHFEMLREEVLPRLIPLIRKRRDRTLRVWSAACSRGQEVFSLAIFLEQALKEMAPDLDFGVHGTDIDGICVEFAKNAVFTKKEVDAIPQIFQNGNFIRGSGSLSAYVKIHPRLLRHCTFASANLLETSTWPKDKFDIIFCRNVFIYFTPDKMQQTAQAFAQGLSDEGHLFLGLAESLNGLKVDLSASGPSVYRKWAQVADVPPVRVLPMAPPRSLEVLCVDDSPTMLTLLKQTFRPEDGFKVRDTAANGQVALEMLKKNNYDLVTLDIHMPLMTGLEMLKAAARDGVKLPPVMVISSVERGEQGLALEMLRFGARDYVQKPSLKDFSARREEILLKAKTVTAAKNGGPLTQSVDHLFADSFKPAPVRGNVALLFSDRDQDLAHKFMKTVDPGESRYKMVSLRGPSVPEAQIAEASAIIVLSRLDQTGLKALQRLNVETFLLEEAYAKAPTALLEIFEIYPFASLSYAVNRYLRGHHDSK